MKCFKEHEMYIKKEVEKSLTKEIYFYCDKCKYIRMQVDFKKPLNYIKKELVK